MAAAFEAGGGASMMLVGARVLVVEDDAIISTLIQTFLAKLGCELVASASSLRDAVDLAANAAIDVAMLDINLAGDMSFPVAAALDARNIPYIYSSAYSVHRLPESMLGARILNKPFGVQQLGDALQSAIARSDHGIGRVKD